MKHLAWVVLCLALAPAPASAQTVWTILFDSGSPFVVEHPTLPDVNVTVQTDMGDGTAGACAAGVGWRYVVHATGGPGNGPYLRLIWCDFDVSGAGAAAEEAGWFTSSALTVDGGSWTSTYHYALGLSFKNFAPITTHASGNSPIKQFVWGIGSADGTDRIIVHMTGGSMTNNDGPCGSTDVASTCFAICAGVSNACAQTLWTNASDWDRVVFAWRWGAEGTLYQRIYIGSSSLIGGFADENTGLGSGGGAIDDWDFPNNLDTGGPRFFDWSSTNQRTADDAEWGYANVVLVAGADQQAVFDAAMGEVAATVDRFRAPSRLRIKRVSLDPPAAQAPEAVR